MVWILTAAAVGLVGVVLGAAWIGQRAAWHRGFEKGRELQRALDAADVRAAIVAALERHEAQGGGFGDGGW